MIKYEQDGFIFRSHLMDEYNALIMYKDLINLLYDELEKDKKLNYSSIDKKIMINEAIDYCNKFSNTKEIYTDVLHNANNIILSFCNQKDYYNFMICILNTGNKFAVAISIISMINELEKDPFEEMHKQNKYNIISYACDFLKMGYVFFKNNGIKFSEMIDNNKLFLMNITTTFIDEEDMNSAERE